MKPRIFFLLLPVMLLLAAVSASSCSPAAVAADEETDTALLVRRLDTLVKKMMSAVERNELIVAIRYCEEGLALELKLPEEKRSYGDLHTRFGEMLETAGLYSYALQHYHAAITASYKLKKNRYASEYHKTARLSGFFFRRDQFDSSVFYMRKAMRAAEKDTDKIWYAAGYNNLAYYFENKGFIDSAEFYYQRAVAVLPLKNRADTGLLASIRDNQAHLLMLRGSYRESENSYRSNEKSYALMNDDVGRIKSLFNVVQVYESEGRHREGLALADSVAGVFAKILAKNTMYRKRYYQLRFNQLQKLNRTAEALTQLEQINKLRDSAAVKEKNGTDALLSTAASGELDRHRTESEMRLLQLNQAKAESQFNWILGMVIFFAGAIIIVVLILFFRKRSSDQKTKILLTEAELRTRQLEGEKLNHELELKKRDLTDMVLINRQKKEIMDELVNDLQEALRAEDRDASLKKLLFDLRARSSTTESMDLIGENIDVVNKAFFDKLEAQFPDLSKGERALCGLLRMNLSTKDIAQLRKIGPDSVKMAKKRLRRKLGLPPESDLYQFMQKI